MTALRANSGISIAGMIRVGRVVGLEKAVAVMARPPADRLIVHVHPFSHCRFARSQMSSATITDSWKSEFELPTNKEVGAASLTEELRADSPVTDQEHDRESDIACLQNQNRVYISVGTLWDFFQSDRGSW